MELLNGAHSPDGWRHHQVVFSHLGRSPTWPLVVFKLSFIEYPLQAVATLGSGSVPDSLPSLVLIVCLISIPCSLIHSCNMFIEQILHSVEYTKVMWFPELIKYEIAPASYRLIWEKKDTLIHPVGKKGKSFGSC